MNIIDQAKAILFAFRASKSLAALHEYGGENTRPIATNYQNLYAQSAAVYACIRLRADSVARPPTRLFRQANGSGTEVTDHPLADLLQRVNPFWTRQQLFRAIETDLGWHGNAFVAVERGKKGNPIELWRMRPDWIDVVPDGTNYLKGYIYHVEGASYKWKVEDVIHFRYANPLNEYWGMAPLSAARMSAELGIDAVAYDRYFFNNLAAPAVALQTREQMAKPQADEILKRWEQAFKGVKSAGRTVVLHSGLEVKPIAISQKDAEWIGAMKWAVDDIARVFRVPTPLVGEEKAVYRNIAEAEASFWHQAIIPELLWIEEILNAELVPLFGDPALRISFDLADVEQLQDDVTARINRYQGLMDRGAMTINEVRRRERLGPDVSWGNEWHAPANLSPVGAVGEGPPPPETAEARHIALNSGPVNMMRLASHEVKLLALDPPLPSGSFEEQIAGILADFFEAEVEKIADAFSKNVGYYATSQDYDWNRWRQLEAPLAKPMADQLIDGAGSGFAEVGSTRAFDVDAIRADAWAETHVAEFITNVTDARKATVRATVQRGVAEGWARDRLRNEILDLPLFDKQRATLIARTESQRAYNEGLYRGYKATGQVTKKSWLNMEVGDVCDDCIVNGASEPIALDAIFPSGVDAPPAHPNCRCRLLPHTDQEGPPGDPKGEIPAAKAPTIVAHTRVNKRAQSRAAQALASLPPKSQTAISQVELWVKQGPKFKIHGRSFRSAANYNQNTGVVNIFNVNRLGERNWLKYMSHEAGHAADKALLRSYELSPNAAAFRDTFRNATMAEGGVTPYSKDWLRASMGRGVEENLAEFHALFSERQIFGVGRFYEVEKELPQSFAAFKRIWAEIGGTPL